MSCTIQNQNWFGLLGYLTIPRSKDRDAESLDQKARSLVKSPSSQTDHSLVHLGYSGDSYISLSLAFLPEPSHCSPIVPQPPVLSCVLNWRTIMLCMTKSQQWATFIMMVPKIILSDIIVAIQFVCVHCGIHTTVEHLTTHFSECVPILNNTCLSIIYSLLCFPFYNSFSPGSSINIYMFP